MTLLEGFVTAAGTGSESLVHASRTALVQYILQLAQVELEFFCADLVDILRRHIDSKHKERLQIPTMEVISFLLEAGITLRLEQGDFA